MKIKFAFLLVLLVVLLAGNPALLFADDLADIAMGGRLYDKWWVDTDLNEPANTHPSYPAAGKASGSSTWRCKECHGWDYRGRDGAYANGSHYTGIGGIRAYAGREPAAIMKILVNPTHQYHRLPQFHLQRLALFVSQGQLDMSQYIDADTKRVNGDTRKGAMIYLDNCAQCHGRDGRQMNLAHDAGKIDYLGSLANSNPWETLHKIRNGQPGVPMTRRHMGMGGARGTRNMGPGMHDIMPAMITRISEASQINLLAYLQTLPKQ